jgi:hypothetical protein
MIEKIEKVFDKKSNFSTLWITLCTSYTLVSTTFGQIINNLTTGYPLKLVDNRTVVLIGII